MLYKAIIEYINYDSHQYKIRIPILDKMQGAIASTNNANLYDATVCILPGGIPEFELNDIVFVDFEDNDMGKPVIMGVLYRPESKSTSSLNLNSLQVNVSAILPTDTSVGEVDKNKVQEIYSL